MTTSIRWGTNDYRIGDRLTLERDPRIIEIEDIYTAEDLEIGIFVVLEFGDGLRHLITGDEFAYRIDSGHFVRLAPPAFTLGQSFLHRATNDTITVHGVSPRTDQKDMNRYFVQLVDEWGEVSYTTVSEDYLTSCLPYTTPTEMPLTLPVITSNDVFPSTVLG